MGSLLKGIEPWQQHGCSKSKDISRGVLMVFVNNRNLNYTIDLDNLGRFERFLADRRLWRRSECLCRGRNLTKSKSKSIKMGRKLPFIEPFWVWRCKDICGQLVGISFSLNKLPQINHKYKYYKIQLSEVDMMRRKTIKTPLLMVEAYSLFRPALLPLCQRASSRTCQNHSRSCSNTLPSRVEKPSSFGLKNRY